eukprot:COSAG06_NODE_10112_length_1748_cov_1.577926_1_plen_541_part_10
MMRAFTIAALATIADGQIYIVGGYDGSYELATALSYDPATDSYAELPSMALARRQFGLGLLGSQLCAVRGNGGGVVNNDACECLDIATDGATWEAMPSLSAPVAWNDVVTVGNTMYSIGGANVGSWPPATSVEVYTQGATAWTTGPSLNVVRMGHKATALGMVIYVAGGTQESGACMADFEALDTSNPGATWEIKADLLYETRDAGFASSGTRLFLVGGANTGATNNDYVQIYETTTDTWSLGAPLGGGLVNNPIAGRRIGLAAAIVGGTFFAVGGNSGGGWPYPSNQAYDIATDTWSVVAVMPRTLYQHSAVAAVPAEPCTAVDTPDADCAPQDCTAVDTPYAGCTVPTCTDVDTPYAGCTVPTCTDVDTPYASCTVPACTDVDTPYAGCTVPDCTADDTPYTGCTVPACTAVETPYVGCIVQDCTAVDTPYAGCTALDCTAADTPYAGCTALDCTAADTPYAGCTALDCTDDTDTPYTGCTVAPCTAADTPYTGCAAADCAGSWSACTTACEAAADRTWTETTAAVGTGAACPDAAACA